MNSRLSQTVYRKAEHLTTTGNPAAIVEMSNLSLRYLIHSLASNRVKWKVCAITVGWWILISENVIITSPSVIPVA